VKESLEGCTKEHTHYLEEHFQEYAKLFHDPKINLPKREVEHKIHLFPNSPLKNIGIYIYSILESINNSRSCWMKDL
jgi:hypothetical protein